MSIMTLIGVLIITLIIFIFSSIKIHNEKLSLKKFWALVWLPSFLLGIGSYIDIAIETHSMSSGISRMLLIFIYGFIVMLPSLMLYAVHILSLEKRFSLPAWKLFLWTGLVAGLSALPYGLIGELKFLFFPIITGMLSMMIVYYFSRWRDKK